jgi:hypothetical protein
VWRSLQVAILDRDNGATQVAGAEVRVFDATTDQLIATGMMDTGSGYNSQNRAPLHLGIGAAGQIDVEVTMPRGGRRVQVRERLDVSNDLAGSLMLLSIDSTGRLVSLRVHR